MTAASVHPAPAEALPAALPLPADDFAAPAEIYASDLPDAAQLLTLVLVLLSAMLLSFMLLPLM